MKLSAYEYAIYIGLPAKPGHISADTIKDESGKSQFLISIRTGRSHPDTAETPLEIMTGRRQWLIT